LETLSRRDSTRNLSLGGGRSVRLVLALFPGWSDKEARKKEWWCDHPDPSLSIYSSDMRDGTVPKGRREE
jgi:hypothetical protein